MDDMKTFFIETKDVFVHISNLLILFDTIFMWFMAIVNSKSTDMICKHRCQLLSWDHINVLREVVSNIHKYQ